jgi:hypothetical protein
MLRKLITAFVRFLSFDTKLASRKEQRFKLIDFDDRAAAALAARQSGIAAIVRGGKGYKWLIFTCPCGCNQQIALNLMLSHSPHWKVEAQTRSIFSVHPSVDATQCGAHFWLRDGKVIWCE